MKIYMRRSMKRSRTRSMRRTRSRSMRRTRSRSMRRTRSRARYGGTGQDNQNTQPSRNAQPSRNELENLQQFHDTTNESFQIPQLTDEEDDRPSMFPGLVHNQNDSRREVATSNVIQTANQTQAQQ